MYFCSLCQIRLRSRIYLFCITGFENYFADYETSRKVTEVINYCRMVKSISHWFDVAMMSQGKLSDICSFVNVKKLVKKFFFLDFGKLERIYERGRERLGSGKKSGKFKLGFDLQLMSWYIYIFIDDKGTVGLWIYW